jgi:hypothetical protein
MVWPFSAGWFQSIVMSLFSIEVVGVAGALGTVAAIISNT